MAGLGAGVDLVVDGGPTAGGLPSTILDVTGAWPRVLRPGAIALGPEDLARV
jgi:tRNA A37 threonylcarbamoyladenosine synthetase subunit TsaC/SUA5/YrdC